MNISVMVTCFLFSKKLHAPTIYEMKQKMFTIGTSSYTIKDSKGTAVYKVSLLLLFWSICSVLFSTFFEQVGFKQLGLGKHLHVTDYNTGEEYYASEWKAIF